MKPSILLLPAALLGLASLALGDSPAADRAATATGSADLRVRIIGIRDDSGTVRVALYRGAQAYEANEPSARQSQKATAPAVEFIFVDIPLGRYSISSFHDSNGNEKLDSNFVGLPTEPYGFSRNARGRFGPPSFDDMAFELAEEGADLEIEVR